MVATPVIVITWVELSGFSESAAKKSCAGWADGNAGLPFHCLGKKSMSTGNSALGLPQMGLERRHGWAATDRHNHQISKGLRSDRRPRSALAALAGLVALILFLPTRPNAPNTLVHGAEEPAAWQQPPCPWNLSALGVTRRGTLIPYWYTADDLDRATSRIRILVICGGDAASATGPAAAPQVARAIVDWFSALPEDSPIRQRVALSIVPCLLPDALTGPPSNSTSTSPKAPGKAPPAATKAGAKPPAQPPAQPPAKLPPETSKSASPFASSPADSYPPQGPAYLSETAPEAAYLWRWLGMFGPDLVVEVRSGANAGWAVASNIGQTASAGGSTQGRDAKGTANALGAPLTEHNRAAWQAVAKSLRAKVGGVPDDALVAVAPRVPPAEVGAIPALRFTWTPAAGQTPTKPAADATPAADRSRAETAAVTAALADLLAALPQATALAPSAARAELRRRAERSPRAVAELLAQHYGHTLPQVEYIPAVAMIGRLRLSEALARAEKTAERTASNAAVLADLERIAAPFAERRQSAEPKSGSGQSGHLLFVALADHLAQLPGDDVSKRRERYRELVVAAANQAFDKEGRPLPAMPFHAEMSDAVFMGGPILAAAGRLTGERRYFDAALGHFDFMAAKVIRPDGIYRHSPLDESAWGRGNGFPALGVALMLSEWPESEPGRDKLIAAHRRHLAALQPHQDPAGEWRQVVDRPESYREFTATCMITFAMMRGMRLGWLDRQSFSRAADRGWQAILTRVADDGRLVDVCTGTGKQTSLRAYYDREALLGRDPRGGAMALLVATERMEFVAAQAR